MSLTLKDIAKEAGVSYATVSRALSGHPEVNKITRKKIIKIAEKMGYQPNAIAQGLVKNETKTIGLIIPDITNPFFPAIARGVEEAAIEKGYSTFLCNTNWNKNIEKKYLNVLIQKQVDGLILTPSSESTTHLKFIEELSPPKVFINKIINNSDTSIIIDNIKGAYQAVEHLINKGHKKIAYIGGEKYSTANKERLRGYKKAMQQNDLPVNNDYVKMKGFNRDSGYFIMKEMLLGESFEITAVFSANDMLALGVIQAIRESNLKIPEDIAIVGFDDIEFASLPEIQLTTVSQPKYQMGQIAFDVLYEKLKGQKANERRIILEPSLVIRETS